MLIPENLMIKRKSIKTFIYNTFLSVLVFFSISFLSVLMQIGPFHYYKNEEQYRLTIGFPFKYYNQFWLKGNDFPNSGWDIRHLIYDCLLTWTITIGVLAVINKIIRTDQFLQH